MEVTWHRRARQDLARIRVYVGTDNPLATRQVAQRILQALSLLADQPGLGQVGRVPDTRELVISGTPSIAAYRVVRGTMVILRVLHGAQRWPEQL